MPKKRKKNAGAGIDFSKVKTKVGKRIKKNAAETRIDKDSLKTTTLRLAHQNALDYESGPGQQQQQQQQRGGNRGSLLKPWRVLVAEASAHPSAAHRRRCVEALKAMVDGGELLPTASVTDGDSAADNDRDDDDGSLIVELIRVCCLRLADESGVVRSAALGLVHAMLERYAKTGVAETAGSERMNSGKDCTGTGADLSPFADSFATHLAGCIANPNYAVQRVSLDATSAVLSSSVGERMGNSSVTRLVSQVGMLLGGNESSNINRGIVGGIALRTAQLECLRRGVAILSNRITGERATTTDGSSGRMPGGDERGAPLRVDGPLFAFRRECGQYASSTSSASSGFSPATAILEDNANEATIEEISRFAQYAVASFTACGPAELNCSGDEVVALRVSGAIDCMVSSVQCLSVLVKYMKKVCLLLNTWKAQERAATARTTSSSCDTWAASCFASLSKVEDGVLRLLPVHELSGVGIREKEAEGLRDSFELLNIASLELLSDIPTCYAAISSDQHEGKRSVSHVHQLDSFNFVNGKIMALACEALTSGSVLLPRDGAGVVDAERDIQPNSIPQDRLEVVTKGMRYLLVRVAADEQAALFAVLCRRIISSAGAKTKNDMYRLLRFISELLKDVEMRRCEASRFEACLLTGIARHLLPKLPEVLWELRAKAPGSSAMWLEVLLSMAKITSARPEFRGSMMDVMNQMAPLVVFERTRSESNRMALPGPIVKLPQQCRNLFASLLYYLPSPLPRTLLKALAKSVLSPSTDVEFTLHVISAIGFRGRRALSLAPRAPSGPSGDVPSDSAVNACADAEAWAKSEIQNCTSFLISVLCGRLEGTNDGYDNTAVDANLEKCRDICIEAARSLCEWIEPAVVIASVLPKIVSLTGTNAHRGSDGAGDGAPDQMGQAWAAVSLQLLQEACSSYHDGETC